MRKNEGVGEKSCEKICTVQIKPLPLHSQTNQRLYRRVEIEKLPCGVMVARRILVPPVRVRILPRQLEKS